MVTLDHIRDVPRADWPTTTVKATMTTPDRLHQVAPNDDLAKVLERMVNEDVNQMPVVEGSRLVGMVTREDLLRLLKTRAELGI